MGAPYAMDGGFGILTCLLASSTIKLKTLLRALILITMYTTVCVRWRLRISQLDLGCVSIVCKEISCLLLLFFKSLLIGLTIHV